MSDYNKLVKTEAKKFYDAHYPEFLDDSGEFGGKSDSPNFSRWIDRTQKLAEVVENLVSGWSNKEYQWVQANTRAKQGYGDPASVAFGSVLSDLLHEIKKIKKKAAP